VKGERGLADLRVDYGREPLDEAAMLADPFEQFRVWFDEAVASGIREPNAMVLGTAEAGGRVSCRTVLLKGFDVRGFVFYTNHGSRKGRQLAANPRAALLFPWVDLERQVEIEGAVERVSAEESEEYFRSRPRGSRLGAWVSEQSAEIESREVLLRRLAELEAEFGEGEIPKPDFWGGYRLVPDSMEFWQGGHDRLHDRFLYRREGDGWRRVRLSP
jgi:pyridoxamine 5'-phosphate oxidase